MFPRSHFMHQGHPLLQGINTEGYLCGGCKTSGYGLNFGCTPCNFHMHEFCSNCPKILSSFLHPGHPLSLTISSPQNTAPPGICDVCEDTVEGLYYCCQTCHFNVHPLCTQFPRSLPRPHAVHSLHHLMFQKPYKDAPCHVCGAVCNSWNWRYRCGHCDGFDVHLQCLAKPHNKITRPQPPYRPLFANVQTTSPYGGVPHGIYAHQPNNLYGQMPVGAPLNMNSSIVYNPDHPFNGVPCNTNTCSTCNQAPFHSNSQHTHIHQAPAQAEAAPAQGQGRRRLGREIFHILTSVTNGVVSSLLADAIS
ncbi:hypothetical protein DCAR_0729736 [Daucus carota subsp. sativus]|uniref:DC1 domain-containing protein n=1 Tax=Daucus carota subsp. sativus TaxID=79200 RepID=A0A161ZQR2_DAUCS|nr:PREDICTED: diacylglycerol kinase theta-like [Daucus carota subsp. sativus]WOH10269.1 hypothetical protein DCAR_0729736 [Daucus carota subsp. sativus]